MIRINEIRIDQPGADEAEFFELSGPAGASLDGLTYLVIGDGAGGSGVIEAVIPLSGLSLDADGLFLAAESTFAGAEAPDLTADLNFENSDNVTHLLVRDFTGALDQDLDFDDDGAAETAPWAAIEDAVALIEDAATGDLIYAPVTVGPDGSFVPGHAYREASGTWTIGDFGGADVTPGQPNDAAPPPVLSASIMEIQGAGHRSPLEGQAVETSGIVTTVAGNGFYVQDPAGDGAIATSDALFVFTGSMPGVAEGDAVTVAGTVSEFTPGGTGTGNLSTTQISGAPDVTVTSSGNALPDAVILGEAGRTPPTQVIDDDGLTSFDPMQDGIDFYESLEAMRVTVDDPQAVSGTNRFGEVFTVADDGADATGLSDRGTINISLDDFNPERIQIQLSGDPLLVDAGAKLEDVTGVLGYSFGNFEVLPAEPVAVRDPSALAPEVTDLTGGREALTIASYNVLNLDPVVEDLALVGDAGDIDDDVGDGRFAEIAGHIVDNLKTPDIVALQEIQDSDGAQLTDVVSAEATLEALVDAIEAAGGPRYAWLDNPFIGDDTSGGQPGGNIRNAFLYNPDRVDFVEGSLRTVTDPQDQQTDPANPFFGSRLPLVADFQFNGETVTVVDVHLSSKGGSSPLFGTIQPPVNGSLDERIAQAEAIRDFIADLKADDPDANVVVAGDFNEFEFEPPLDLLEDAGLTNLTGTLPPDERYSYIFQGNSQSLDHILVSEGLAEGAEFDAVHVNAEFAETPGRASDHDPLLARLTLGDPAVAETDVTGVRDLGASGLSFVDVRLTNIGTAPIDAFMLDLDLADDDARFLTGFSRDLRAPWSFDRDTGTFETGSVIREIGVGDSVTFTALVRGLDGAEDVSATFTDLDPAADGPLPIILPAESDHGMGDAMA